MNEATDAVNGGEDFERATRVRGGGGVYEATVSRAWEICGPNGGYMATIALRAAGAEAKIATPVSFYAQFLRIARFDAIEARVTVVQSGRRSESIRVSLVQDGKAVLEALLRTALPSEGLEHTALTPPDVPPPEALPRAEDLRDPNGGHLSDPSRGAVLVADQEGVTVGFAILASTWTVEDGGRVAWLEELYVVPSLRGAGIGKCLLEEALRTAREMGCLAMDLEVDFEHARAENLYARAGFRRLPRTRWSLRLG